VALLTVGHGTAGQDELVGLLRDAGVTGVVDVRRFPGSRRHPHVAREELQRWLPRAGIGYRWDERLGGRRRGDPDSPHRGLRNEQFRAYADHMETPTFAEGLGELLCEAARAPVAMMCSESVWWRCHRRLISDTVELLHGEEVRHLMHDGRLQPHVPTDVVRVVDGRLLYGPPHPPA
jgi:uncharacterized protein (DUF488 family)